MGLPRVLEGTACHHLLFDWTVEPHLLKFLPILIPETCDAHTLSHSHLVLVTIWLLCNEFSSEQLRRPPAPRGCCSWGIGQKFSRFPWWTGGWGGGVHLPVGKTTIAKGDDIWSFNHGPVIMGLIMRYAGF